MLPLWSALPETRRKGREGGSRRPGHVALRSDPLSRRPSIAVHPHRASVCKEIVQFSMTCETGFPRTPLALPKVKALEIELSGAGGSRGGQRVQRLLGQDDYRLKKALHSAQLPNQPLCWRGRPRLCDTTGKMEFPSRDAACSVLTCYSDQPANGNLREVSPKEFHTSPTVLQQPCD